jgi:protein O-GlcNAcase/histone acetyltransferase
MATNATTDFLAGVIEGFYGRPWSQAERLELFDWMAAWGLNTYVYAPKDDLKHRALWREPYSDAEAETIGELIAACGRRGLRFVYALSPGLDIRYSDAADFQRLIERCEQILALGGEHFALFFDDIPDRLDHADIQRWGSLASAQCQVANALFDWLRQRRPRARCFFCPTAYCGRMAQRQVGGLDYLATVGRELRPEIEVFWTGPEIISREITVGHVQEVQKLLRRKPLIWDNLHANDYDGCRFFCGPYAGRPAELRNAVSGLLSNPNCEFPLNYVPLRTLAAFVQCEGNWDARAAWLSALREWWPRFATIGRPVTLEDLMLFGDCYYLPHEEGPEAEALYQRAAAMVNSEPGKRGDNTAAFQRLARRLREFCARMTELRDRPLFYALSRRAWELREELDLLERYADWQARGARPDDPCRQDFPLPGTWRGGMVARLQRLLVQQPDGSFARASRAENAERRTSNDESAQPARASRHSSFDIRHSIRLARSGDEAGAYYVCLKTGDHGKDGELFYRDDPDALGRVFVGPYLAFEPELSLILEDDAGICGYALAALDSRAFYARYEREWRPKLCAQFPAPQGDPRQWTRTQLVHHWYHHPDYFTPEPYEAWPSHLHIDLLERARGRGHGRRMVKQLMDKLRQRGSPGVHLGVSMLNTPAQGFYRRLGFVELIRVGSDADGCIYMGRSLRGY